MGKTLVIGIDEAGYGPNLGPLVIGASVWLVSRTDDVESLADAISPEFQSAPVTDLQKWIPLGDSKKLYSSQGSIRPLSIGVTALAHLAQLDLAIARHRPTDCDAISMRTPKSGLMDARSDSQDASKPSAPWYEKRSAEDGDLFPDVNLETSPAIRLAEAKLRKQSIQLVALDSRIVDEASFNRGLEQHGNKSSLLSHVSVALAKSSLENALLTIAFDTVHFQFDKHGGRNRYQSILFEAFPETWFHVIQESTDASVYSAQIEGLAARVSFQAKGDRTAAPAAASMIAKWTREVYMDRFNQFWNSHLPNLKPTAGYPVDAKRFEAEIKSTADKLGLERDAWWRRS